jgi:formate hydrogenlyase subunit 6/NADH:ubiquinone oxidoreductase subunit I
METATVKDLELWAESLEVEDLGDAVSPGFTTAFTGACIGCASCPGACASSVSSVSSTSG